MTTTSSLPLKDNETVYFAYGTMLEVASMREHCPSAVPLGVFRLKDYRLDFKTCRVDPAVGGCTLTAAPGNVMHGLLYKIPSEERRGLDKAAGLDKGLWANFEVTLLDQNDNSLAASTYVIADPGGPYDPPDSYVRPILAGAREIPLQQEYVEQLEAIVHGDR